MNTITFWKIENGVLHSYNSYNDLGLILNAKKIGAAAPKILSVDITSGDGELDYTEHFGVVNYNNRTLWFEFSDIGNGLLDNFSRLQNLLNGQKWNITLSDDADYYYIGRVYVNEWQSDRNIGKVTVDVNAEPYKMKQATTVIYRLINGETIINCPNLKKTVTPSITFTTVGAKGTVSLGEQESSEFTSVCEDEVIFGAGDNLLKVTPTADAKLPMGVRVEYREGSL